MNRVLSLDEERRIDALWSNSAVVDLVDLNDEIALMARRLMREGMARGWRLRTNDAIHLASAQWVGAAELHTYDLHDFEKFSGLVGIEIHTPHAVQPRLF